MRAAMLLFLLASSVLTAPLIARYYERANIIVVDTIGRPVPYATVWATYPLRFERDANTSRILTNLTGRATIQFTNFDEVTDRGSRYEYTVYAKFGKSQDSAQLRHFLSPFEYREDPYPLTVKAHYLWLRVLDQRRAPHVNASVYWENSSALTDSSGNARMMVGDGKIQVRVAKGGFENLFNLTVTNDSSEQAIWPVYSPLIRVLDDRGEPLLAELVLGGVGAATNESGYAQFQQSPMQSAELTVTYEGKEKRATLYFATQEKSTIIFDTHRPIIKSVTVEVINGLGRITADVADEGLYASGFDESSRFSVRYRAKGRDREIPMYTLERGVYRADIPAQPPNTIVSFTLTVTDRDGNVQTAEGEYTVPLPRPGENQSGNWTGPPITPPAGDKIFGFDSIAVYAGVGAAIIAFIAGYLLIFRKKEEY